MKNSIETMWKEGFLNEKSLIVPKINNLYSQKSKYLVDKIKRMFKINIIAIILVALLLPVIYYLIDAIWQGVGISILLLCTAWYSKKQMKSIKALNQGATSYDYLISFDQWLKNTLLKNENVLRFSYPLYFLIVMSTILSAWSKQEKLTTKFSQKFPDLVFIGDIPLFALIITVIGTLMMFFFSRKIYRWDVRLVYGRIFKKLEETIYEMEKLKGEE